MSLLVKTKERSYGLSYVEMINLSKRYGDTLAVDDINLSVEEGEFFSLLGPSGCGKTTTLRMVAGFVRPDAGKIIIGGTDMTRLPPEKRGIGIVFQNYAIFPHMNVFDNIAFGLRMRKLPKREIGTRVQAALEQVNLSGYERRYQREMSGGEQQRVALARVLITEPRILLLDEPLSALDKKLREEMKYWIKELQHELKITTVYVTHDQGEALTMSDRIAVMNKAQVAQVGGPEEIYEHPASRFVAGFIGESNLLQTSVKTSDGTMCRLAIDGQEITAPATGGADPGRDVSLVVRPERVLVAEEAEALGGIKLTARVIDQSFQGSIIRYRLDLAGQTLVAEVSNRTGRPMPEPGAEVAVSWDPGSTEILTD